METSATAIDLIFTNRAENILKAGTVDFGISDHSLIFAVRKCRTHKSQKNSRYYRSYKRFNSNDFLNDLSQVPWETVAQHDNPNVCWRIWSTFFLQVLDLHAPLRCMRVRGNSLPLMSSYIRNLMKQRDFYKKRAIKYNAQNHWMKYKELRNKVNSEIRKAKSIYFCNRINDCAQSKDIGQSWKVINNLLGKNRKSNNIPQLKIDDIIISDDNLIAESLNDFFINIGAKLASESDRKRYGNQQYQFPS